MCDILDTWLCISVHVVNSFMRGRKDANAFNSVIEYVIGWVNVEHDMKLIP
jgi:hypothetical protein